MGVTNELWKIHAMECHTTNTEMKESDFFIPGWEDVQDQTYLKKVNCNRSVF